MDTAGKFLIDAGFNQGWKHLSEVPPQHPRRRRTSPCERLSPAPPISSAPDGTVRSGRFGPSATPSVNDRYLRNGVSAVGPGLPQSKDRRSLKAADWRISVKLSPLKWPSR
jgi:hypothetical protein